MSALEDAAQAYAQQGLHVFPLQPNGKTPLTAHGLDDATLDRMTIETWWGRWPNANIAIRTGDLVVVDEDRLGALDELAAQANETIPATGVVKTAAGRHYYFLQPEGQRIRNTASRLAPGIDTRGDGGYVVAPPSVHPSGVPYEWMARDETVVMPAWMVERLARRQPDRQPLPDIPLGGTTPYGRAALEQEIGAVAVAVEGTRNDQLNRAAFALGQLVAGGEVDWNDAQNALAAAANAAGLPALESQKTIRSGFESGHAEPRRAPDDSRAERVTSNGTSLRAVTEADPLTATQPERDSWLPVNLNDLPDTPPVQPNLGATHLVYPGKRHVFSGPPESAKTLAAYCILIQIARHGGRGLLIDFEMGGYDARKRLQELGATPGEIDRILYIEPEQPATTARILPLVDLNPELVVIDAAAGAYALEGLDDNKRLEVEKVSTLYIRQFWRNGIATILIDHVVKDAEARGRYAIGSERKLGGSDVHFGFDTIKEISRGSRGKYKITTHKDRGGFLKRGYLADLNLDSDPDTHNIAWSFTEPIVSTDDKGHFRYTKIMQKISRELAGVDQPLSKSEVKRRVGGNSDQLGKAIEAMIDEGYMTASDGERGAVNIVLARAYTEAQDPRLNPENDPTLAPVPVLFSSCSGTGDRMTCSPVPGLTSPEQVEQPSTPPENTPKNDDLFQGWLNQEGTLDTTYLASLEPDPDDVA